MSPAPLILSTVQYNHWSSVQVTLEHQTHLQEALNNIFGVLFNQLLLSVLEQPVDILESQHGPLLGVRPGGVGEKGDGLVEGERVEHCEENCLAGPANLLVAATREDHQLFEDASREVRELGHTLAVRQSHLQGGQSREVVRHHRVVL